MLKYFSKIKKSHCVILALTVVTVLFTQMCTSRFGAGADTLILDRHGDAFSGSELRRGSSSSVTFATGSVTCASCHKEIYKTHIGTAHYHDSRPADAATIKGSFDKGRNRFVYADKSEVLMEQRGDRFYQTSFHDGKEDISQPFDIVIGSGRKGQTYLYWGDDQDLFQLPVSYYTPTDSWSNSPGLNADDPDFSRPIAGFCLECHATFAKTTAQTDHRMGDRFNKDQILFGIDCEKCHGPGKAHEAYHQAHPGETMGKFIINAARLSRQQRLDACALCHSGWRQPIAPAFSFRPGDNLNRFYISRHSEDSASTLDVHGNQYGLLRSSKCFIQSEMDCSSCHDVHRNEAGNVKLYSRKCMTCHNQPAHNTCTMPATAGLVLSDNCIDCHMPALTTRKIIVEMSRVADSIRNSSPMVRTHHIAIYTASTKEYLEKLRSGKTRF